MANDKWSGSNPWLGLAPYTEGTPLYGRTKESIQLADIIKDYMASVVFGKSGIGKSSLLSAGISPLLREENYIPVRIRLVHNTDVSYIEQIESKVRETVKCIDRLPSDVSNLGLWDFFHRNTFTMENGIDCIPVILLDQFEEIYTLTDADHKKEIIAFFNELSSLLNDIKPDNVIEAERKYSAIQNDSDSATPKRGIIKRSVASALNYTSATTFRFVICLREDKLYLLERNSANIPSLKANRYNLQALSPESALEVIMCPRPELFSNEEATAIIDKLADMGDEGIQTVDPAILSLFLYKYYEKQGQANYDNIFADYYQEATKDIKGKSIAFLEDHLLTLGGYRNQVPLDDALSSGVTQDDIQSLLCSIIIRKEQRKGIDYIEFSHDRLCAEAMKNRNERVNREQAKKARRRMLLSFFVFAVSAAMLSVVLWLTFKYQTSEEGRLSEKQQKELFKEKNDSLALLDSMNRRKKDSLLVLNKKNLAQKREIERQRDEINTKWQNEQKQSKLLAMQLAMIEKQQREIEMLRLQTAVDSIVINDNIDGQLSEKLPYSTLSKASILTVTGKLNVNDLSYIKSAVGIGNLKRLYLDRSYIVDNERACEILNFEGIKSLEMVTLPYNMKKISSFAFCRCSGLINVQIPDSVTSIGGYAFNNCSELTAISIPEGVISLKYNAFDGCSRLTSIIIPKSVTSISYDTFEGCSGLTSIVVEKDNPNFDSRNSCNAIVNTSTNELILGCRNTVIPRSVTSIGKKAFYYCASLKSITIPNSVTSIGEDAFVFCDSLKSITIPKSVTSIGENAFRGCSNLISISVEKGNPNFDSRNNCSAIINTTTNELILGCGNTIIPNSVNKIGRGAFIFNKKLKSITIPNSVNSIGERAFWGCYALKSLTLPGSVTYIDKSAFYCNKLIYIYSEIPDINNVFVGEDAFDIDDNCLWEIPKGKAKDYKSQSWWKSSWKILEEFSDTKESLETYRNLAALHAELGDYKNAEKFFRLALKDADKLFKEAPDDYLEVLARLSWSLSMLYEEMKKDEEYNQMLTRTLGLYRQLYKKDKSTGVFLADVLNKKAYQYMNVSQIARAMNTIEEAISISPEEANYYDSKGEFLLISGKKHEALEMWNKVLELNPNFLDYYPDGTNLSNGLKKLGLIE